jgi:hypothetical protein
LEELEEDMGSKEMSIFSNKNIFFFNLCYIFSKTLDRMRQMVFDDGVIRTNSQE